MEDVAVDLKALTQTRLINATSLLKTELPRSDFVTYNSKWNRVHANNDIWFIDVTLSFFSASTAADDNEKELNHRYRLWVKFKEESEDIIQSKLILK